MSNLNEPKPRLWQSLAEYSGEGGPEKAKLNEFAEELPLGVAATPVEKNSRRDFFKLMGLSGAAALAACQRGPTQQILPFTKKPDELTPGSALWYASVCGACPAQCGLLVKSRDGRPIKMEGNPLHPVSLGSLCATGQAAVLGLYDADRARSPSQTSWMVSWKEIDDSTVEALKKAGAENKAIRVVLPWCLGPSEEAALAKFLKKYPSAKTVRYDATGELDAIARATEALLGSRQVPEFLINKAKCVVSFGADFLGSWLSPAGFSRQYAKARDVEDERARHRLLRHIQVESTLSLTGSCADIRYAIKPSEMFPVLAALLRKLAPRAESIIQTVLSQVDAQLPVGFSDESLDRLVSELKAAGPNGLVLYGGDEPGLQLLALLCNWALRSSGVTVRWGTARKLDNNALLFDEFLAELAAKKVGAVLFLGVNPVYSHPQGAQLKGLLEGLFSLSTAHSLDETALSCHLHAPESHWLESWSDSQPQGGLWAVSQPLVAPLFDTRSRIASLLVWAGEPSSDHDFVRSFWEREVYSGGANSFQMFWDDVLRRGIWRDRKETEPPQSLRAASISKLEILLRRSKVSSSPIELLVHPSLYLRSGEHANNAWLQELPDALSKTVWTNYAGMSKAQAEELGLGDGDEVKLQAEGFFVNIPIYCLPGIPKGVVAVAAGYGRTAAGKVGNNIGIHIAPLAATRRAGTGVIVSKTGAHKDLAQSQTYSEKLDSLGKDRKLVRSMELAQFLEDPRKVHEGAVHEVNTHGLTDSMWSGHKYEGHRWGMVVDLGACTGCSACVVSCQAENNIPVVGEREVRIRREMSWMRIDRYFGGEPEFPEVFFQPMMCWHCENAPCETVCPVLATVHSSEGLNQQVYNRCVGTRYCANNCPPKVRRFNWFTYKHEDSLERMVLNPDVAIRSRGVMEKCSMCVQRIQEGKARANSEGRTLQDGEVLTACQQSCPTQAIHFGDLNNPNSKVAQMAARGRSYKLLTELNIGPVVSYMAKVTNRGGGKNE
ncbi:MAG: TAT-variant-translocated molybdopterin oxidoreductase [Proteobacteria bacterium]|nr:TAT-variant-translocated molybdopterin oxidoreductase [Cystobacterineae bacterium]MCL2258294.1 TAT-variant-translocated molybdopterin oxidoreductase [Cystobacterineae bacterium]MCL2315068.1 TAT-variant-translocated molybdopterin oxidoreductase [Pseudomonadota bacterium]